MEIGGEERLEKVLKSFYNDRFGFSDDQASEKHDESHSTPLESDFSSLPHDMLSKICSMLTYEERLRMRLVCKEFKKRAFAIQDTRALRADLLTRITEEEKQDVRTFLLQKENRVPGLGRMNIGTLKRIVDVLNTNQIISLKLARLEDSEIPHHLKYANPHVKFSMKDPREVLEKFPNLSELKLIYQAGVKEEHEAVSLILQSVGHRLRKLEILMEGSRHGHADSEILQLLPSGLEELSLLDQNRRVEDVIGSEFLPSSLRSLTMEGTSSNGGADIVLSRAENLSTLTVLSANRYGFVDAFSSAIVKTIADCFPKLTCLDMDIVSDAIHDLPKNLRTLRTRNLLSSDMLDFLPQSLTELDLCLHENVSCFSSMLPNLKSLTLTFDERSSGVLLPVDEKAEHPYAKLEYFSVCGPSTLMSGSFGVVPSSLKELYLENISKVYWTSLSRCDSLRVISLKSCPYNLDSTDCKWAALLPRQLRRMIIDCPNEKWSLSVDDWICLPPTLENCPRLESVVEGLCQFL